MAEKGEAEINPPLEQHPETANNDPKVSPADPSSFKDIHTPTNAPNCIFCKICSKEAPGEIKYEDSDYVCFEDRKPVSTCHYLVVPRQHIRDPRTLTSKDIPMVERMVEIGKQVLEEHGSNVEEARMGFHWPPFIFVKHLHLHIISPASGMSWLNRNIVFRSDSLVFSTPSYMLNYLKTKTS